VRTGLSQQIGLRQELRINPRLYQAMDMLYMPMMDLQQHLKQELLLNPFLELVEPEEEDQDLAGEPVVERKAENGHRRQSALARVPGQQELETEGQKGPSRQHDPDDGHFPAHEPGPGMKKVDPVVS
jgi:DNA-directed RNA polymerase specialized sigma54-like protein